MTTHLGGYDMKELTVTSFFCGAGGFDIGFLQAGFEINQAFDFDEHAIASYRHNVGRSWQADVRNLIGPMLDISPSTVWLYGFPCQDLSKANRKRQGLVNGKKSSMFFEIMRLLDEVENKPAIILAENVRGLSKYFDILEEEYDKRGYRLVKTLYNSKFWGVAQNRERYFVAGIRKDIEKEFTFPVQGTDVTVKLKDIVKRRSVLPVESPLFSIVNGELRVKQPTKLGYAVAEPGDGVNFAWPKSKTRRGRVGKQVAQTLITFSEQGMVLEDLTVQEFSPSEYARIQGFPDSYEQVVTDSQFYKQIGNAVSVPVARVIALQMKEFLTSL
jgi:DNA (cytosine-5)-methyltransferase 1